MEGSNSERKRSAIRRWVRRGFIAWATLSTLWLLNSYRTQGVARTLLTSDAKVTVQSSRDALAFLPTAAVRSPGLLFIVGAGVAAEAYAPLLRPFAEQGYPVFVVRLPYRIAPLERHKATAVDRVHAIIGRNETIKSWVIAGHSLGGALACRIAADSPSTVTAMVLIGTSHPKRVDLSRSRMPITKVYASNDGIATVKMINATRGLLPRDTRWIEIEGGNHSQFGHYGHQLFDGSPTITREQQQDITRAALLDALGHEVPPTLPDADRIRIAEAFRLGDALGNRVWPDWDKAPFAVLLVTPGHEFLIRHPKPSEDFTLLGEDAVLKQKVWSRKRKFQTDFLATFPAVGPVPTIVIGQAEGTAAKTSTRWVITLLHEHFHQLQYSQPGYYADVDGLGLARGDQTGMWMLNYAFPYTTPEVKEQFSVMYRLLAETLRVRQRANFPRKLRSYLEAKKKLRSLLKDDDYTYLAFQAWQEGIARYTEVQIADLAAAEYTPSKEFQTLKDYRSFQDETRAILGGIEKELTTLQLDEAKRTVFYALGAAEGLVLDTAHPGWRKRYFEDKFSLDGHFRREK